MEQAVQLVTNDNLDLGCALIEQAATDKVSSDDCALYACLWCVYFSLWHIEGSSSSIKAFS